MRRAVVAGCAALALALSGACAADDTDNDDVAAESGSVEEYCDMSAELDAAGAPPSEEQLEEIVDVAPDEIKDDVRTLADAIREEDFEAEAAQEADRNLQEWEEEHCDRPADDGAGQGTDDGADNEDPAGDDPAGIREEDNGGQPGTDEGPAGGPSSGEPGEGGGDEGNSGPGGGQDDDTTETTTG